MLGAVHPLVGQLRDHVGALAERVLQGAAHAHVLGALLCLRAAEAHAHEVVPLLAGVAAHHGAVVGLAAQAVRLVYLHDGVGVLGEVRADELGLCDQLSQQLRGGGGGVEAGLIQARLPLLGFLQLAAQVLQLRVALADVNDALARLVL